MANKSTFYRNLPRDLVKLAALSKVPAAQGPQEPGYVKRQSVNLIDPKTKVERLDGDGNPIKVFQVLPDYDRMLRLLFADAHKHFKAFKNSKLPSQLAAQIKADIKAEASADLSGAVAAIV